MASHDDWPQKLSEILNCQREILKGQTELKQDQHQFSEKHDELKHEIEELKKNYESLNGDLKRTHLAVMTEIHEECADIASAVDMLAELTLQLSNTSLINKRNIEARIMTPQTQKILSSFGFLHVEEALRTPQVGPPNATNSHSASSDPPSSDASASPACTPGLDTMPKANRRRHRHRSRPIQSDHSGSQHSKHTPELHEVPEAQSSPQELTASVTSRAMEKRRVTASPYLKQGQGVVAVAEMRKITEKELLKEGSGTDSDEEDEGDTVFAPRKPAAQDFDPVIDCDATPQACVRDVPKILEIRPPPFWCRATFRVALACLRLGGMRPWTRKWRRASLLYRVLPFLLNAGFLASCVFRMSVGPELSEDMPATGRLITDLVLGFSAFFGPACLGVGLRVLKERHTDTAKLHGMSQRRGFSGTWITQSSHDFLIVAVMWIASVTERTRATIMKTSFTGLDCLHVALFACAAANLLCSAFSILICSRGMTCMVDGFLLSVLRGRSLAGCERSWKLRMALMRRVCSGFERCCILLALTATVAAFTTLVDMANGYRLELIPHTILVCYFPWAFWQMASVTDVCKRVPPTVNSMISHTESGNNALYLVQFIQASDAGFYVYDTLLARGLVQKSVYFTGVALFAASTNIFQIRF
eukprot:TRINITY_DN23773_c0_g2_i1.p1 TRINITY_DN23773_c0_g2~~TRINITY_DN23773_c0_g2_i1.p1  ORF type:complete len:647 (+),score=85.53 TRINITY_DN23773_c0_g2_i1:178-2118(+)